jgi:hypothetical protein
MSWERFRELFEQEYLSNLRDRTRERYDDVFNLFEELCRLARPRRRPLLCRPTTQLLPLPRTGPRSRPGCA